jgi:hypothetical protein
MEYIIRDMIQEAYKRGKYAGGSEIMQNIGRVISELAATWNAPSDWREIGNRLADEWNSGEFEYGEHWVCDALGLGDHGADECYGAATFGKS